MRGYVVTLALSMALATGAVACGEGNEGASDKVAAGATVAATLKDFTLTIDKNSAPAGGIEFDVTNQGPSEHEFVILKTDLSVGALPVKSNKVDTGATGIKSIAEVEAISAGSSKSLTKILAPGNYVLICNISGHYQQGIRTGFTVK